MYTAFLIALALANALAMQAYWPGLLTRLGKSQTMPGDLFALVLFVVCYLGPIAMGVIAGLVLSRHVAW